MHIIHSWSVWSPIREATLTDGTVRVYQTRWCRKCRKADVRFV